MLETDEIQITNCIIEVGSPREHRVNGRDPRVTHCKATEIALQSL